VDNVALTVVTSHLSDKLLSSESDFSEGRFLNAFFMNLLTFSSMLTSRGSLWHKLHRFPRRPELFVWNCMQKGVP
jgi:hypothetical protein